VAAELKIPCVEGRKEGREEKREDAEGGICTYIYTYRPKPMYILYILYMYT
jgi:hypothetical protein